MARIRYNDDIQQAYEMPSLGALLGSSVSSSVFDKINNNGHITLFGGQFEHMHQDFFDKHIRPIEELSYSLRNNFSNIMNPDVYRQLTTIEDLRAIPSRMEIPILMMPEVHKLFMTGRIDGFGYVPESLPTDDTFGRLIDNFHCPDVAAASDDDGWFELSAVQFSDDPDLTDDELRDVTKSREFILNYVLAETDRDPTDIDNIRG